MILVMGTSGGGFIINHHPERLGKTEEELLELGVLLEGYPEAEVNEDKETTLKFDGTQLYYEYVDIVPTELEALNNKLDNAIMELSILIATGGM